jgi:hypothetical protein
MPDTRSQSLQSWQNFYLLMGGASATLVGLMFVAIWLGSKFFSRQTVVEIRTFVSPTLMYFVYVLITSAVLVSPTVTRTFLGILLLLTGLISLGISLSGVPYMHHQYRNQQTDMTDWMWYFLIPGQLSPRWEDASDGRLGCGLTFALHPLLTGNLTLAG